MFSVQNIFNKQIEKNNCSQDSNQNTNYKNIIDDSNGDNNADGEGEGKKKHAFTIISKRGGGIYSVGGDGNANADDYIKCDCDGGKGDIDIGGGGRKGW